MSAEDDDVNSPANARLGKLLKGKYTLDRVLGTGGMATVYSATHRNGKEFAVKVLHSDLSNRQETRTRFLREGYLANRVNHPGAVAVLDDDIAEDGGAFLVMELLHGETLETLWERYGTRLPLALVAGVGLQLLDVLAAAHSRGLVHRDIKPGNLMVTRDGQVKVLDFGIARLRDVAAASTTQTGMVMGTPAFMAPEHALAKADQIDAQTDLWEAGATLFTLATGQLVHDGENAQQILVRAATSPARPLASVAPNAPAAFCAVIDRALAFEKSARWPNASAMREALRAASRTAFNAVPTPEVIATLLEQLNETDRIARAGSTQPPIAPDVSGGPDSGEMSTGRHGGAAQPSSAGGTLLSSRDPTRPPPRPPAARGPITAEAVASDSSVRRSVAKPQGLKAAAIAAASILGIGTALLIAMRSSREEHPASMGTAAPATTGAPSRVESTSVPVQPSSAPTATLAPIPPASTAAPVPTFSAVEALPMAPPHPVVVAPRQGPAAPAVASGAAATAPPPPNKPSCNPPYEFDDKGNKRWKRECL